MNKTLIVVLIIVFLFVFAWCEEKGRNLVIESRNSKK